MTREADDNSEKVFFRKLELVRNTDGEVLRVKQNIPLMHYNEKIQDFETSENKILTVILPNGRQETIGSRTGCEINLSLDAQQQFRESRRPKNKYSTTGAFWLNPA